MKMEAWRMVKEKHLATAFSGQWAAKTGGRWNLRGVAVVYASSTRALAALETLVHLNPAAKFNYVMIGVEFDDKLVERINVSALPSDWQIEPPPVSIQRLGGTWVRLGRSAVLAVPSAIIPEETNYVLNPAHADFKRITIGNPAPFRFDSRLLT